MPGPLGEKGAVAEGGDRELSERFWRRPTRLAGGPRDVVILRLDPSIHSVTHERCYGAEFCSAASYDQGHGMDPRVCARRFAPCSARG